MASNSESGYSSSDGMVVLRNVPEFWYAEVELDPTVEHRFSEYEDAVYQGKAILTKRDNRARPGIFAVEYALKPRGEHYEGQHAVADARKVLLDEINQARLESEVLPHTMPALCPR
ncbi:hypothetical protein BDV40DRAFT_297747 [Aspergillus tamarii]|uniref:Uncharacterized protein n=1 Tax=Aspergillus tamarii TaxID=41984 RepID=A0A5N6V2T8_ASPTM|nr:hypothetical protein BDV40DRAFT_297747 [Aspergillus tamarii]